MYSCVNNFIMLFSFILIMLFVSLLQLTLASGEYRRSCAVGPTTKCVWSAVCEICTSRSRDVTRVTRRSS